MIWNLIARAVTHQPVRDWLIACAKRTPYEHLPGYMDRWHLLQTPWFSIRVHHIKRGDLSPDQHTHPWNFRTIILRGSYIEVRGDHYKILQVGDTARLRIGEHHVIRSVSAGGVWTLFFTGKKTRDWGFMTRRGYVDRKAYTGDR